MTELLRIFNWKSFSAGVALLVVAFLGLGMVNNQAAALPTDCDTSAIVKCGFQDKAGFKADYNENLYKDIKTIYADARFNFTADEMDRFMSTAVWATAYKDSGKLILDDGRVVATGSWSIGRNGAGGGNPYTTTIGGKTYYWGYNKTAFAASSIRALVMMDKNNKYMEFAVLTSCGNPITGTKPVFQCDMLQKKAVGDNKYEFWTDATAKNGATVKSVTYDFGDGTPKVTETDYKKHVPHTYAKTGDFTATVTVTYNVNGKDQTESVQTKCKTTITVKKVVIACSYLKATLIKGNREYGFLAVGYTEGGAKLVSASFDFGDGQKANNLTNVVAIPNKPNEAGIVTSHTYAKELTGKKTITADLTFTVGTDKQNKKCMTEITLKEETCADKPNAPECQPPKTCKDTPTLPECNPPKTCEEKGTCKVLPSTGPAETLLTTIGISSVAGAAMYYRAARRNWINNIFKR